MYIIIIAYPFVNIVPNDPGVMIIPNVDFKKNQLCYRNRNVTQLLLLCLWCTNCFTISTFVYTNCTVNMVQKPYAKKSDFICNCLNSARKTMNNSQIIIFKCV